MAIISTAFRRFFTYGEQVRETVAAYILEQLFGVASVLRGDFEVVASVRQCRDNEGEARRLVAEDGGSGYFRLEFFHTFAHVVTL